MKVRPSQQGTGFCKSEMDADLMRTKTAIETGRAPHDAAHPAAQPRES